MSATNEQLTILCSDAEIRRVVSGEQTVITREVRPRNAAQFVILNRDKECIGVRQDYKTVKLLSSNRKGFIVCEFRKIQLMEIVDENGELCFYDHEGEQYQMVDADVYLGKLLSVPTFL